MKTIQIRKTILKIWNYIDSKIITIAGLSMFILFLLLVYWYLFPYQVVGFGKTHLQTNKNSYIVGEKVVLNLYYNKYLDNSPISVSRWYENSMVFFLPTQVLKINKGENKYKVFYEIPTFFESGKYKICELIKYQVNPIRVVEYRNCSNHFEIVAN